MRKNTPLFFLGSMPKIVHFIGIGGIGISALAQWFLAQKWAVSGSDIFPNETTHSLQKLGVKVKFGHKKANIPQGCALVIYTQAIRPKNIELKEARQRKISVLSYPEAIGELTRLGSIGSQQAYTTIAVAGAHGKSTTTALVGLILIKAGFDPTVIIGTKLKEFPSINSPRPGSFDSAQDKSGQAWQVANSEYGTNFRFGKSKYLVLEADEYGGAFLHYSPFYTIVTNIDKEHLDFYKNLENIKKSFLAFLSRTQHGGALILNRDSKILFSLKPAIEKISSKKHLKINWYSLYGEQSRTMKNPENKKIKKIIRIAGKHNVSNALGAFYLSKILNVPEKTALRAIADYRGSWRRMEYRGKYQVSSIKYQVSGNKNPKRLLPDTVYQIPVYDDYAHHPTEIKATLRAFREKFPRPGTGRGSPRNSGAAKPAYLICVFQPHQAERLRILFKDFRSAFTDADITLILPIYRVAGRDIINHDFTSEKLVTSIQKKYPKKLIFYVKNPKNLKKAVGTLLSNTPSQSKSNLRQSALNPRKSAVLVMMGAGDIVKYTDRLIKN